MFSTSVSDKSMKDTNIEIPGGNQTGRVRHIERKLIGDIVDVTAQAAESEISLDGTYPVTDVNVNDLTDPVEIAIPIDS